MSTAAHGGADAAAVTWEWLLEMWDVLFEKMGGECRCVFGSMCWAKAKL